MEKIAMTVRRSSSIRHHCRWQGRKAVDALPAITVVAASNRWMDGWMTAEA